MTSPDDDGGEEPDESDPITRVAKFTYETSGLTTDLSDLGDIVLFGFDDGNLMIYDDDRKGVDRSVSR